MAQGKRSGGPQTPAGKLTVSRNAIKSGAYSKLIILPGEDESEFTMLEQQFIDDFVPQDIAEQAMVHELAVLTWKKIRLEQLEHRTIIAQFNAPPKSFELPSARFINKIGVQNHWAQLHTFQESDLALYQKSLEHARKLAKQKSFAPEDLQQIQLAHPNLYDLILDQAKLFSVADRPHEELVITRVEESGGSVSLFMTYALKQVIPTLENLIWIHSELPAIQAEVQQYRDTKLISLMQNINLSRAHDDLSRFFFRTLAELRKHQQWRYQKTAIDLAPAEQDPPQTDSP